MNFKQFLESQTRIYNEFHGDPKMIDIFKQFWDGALSLQAPPELRDMELMYQGQCRITDELSDKLEAEKERKGDARIAELEAQLSKVNEALSVANSKQGKVTYHWNPSEDMAPKDRSNVWVTDGTEIHPSSYSKKQNAFRLLNGDVWPSDDNIYWSNIDVPTKPRG